MLIGIDDHLSRLGDLERYSSWSIIRLKIPTSILMGALIGFVLFFALGSFGGGNASSISAGLIMGCIGSVIGAALALPFYLLFRKDLNQEIIEQQDGLFVDDDSDTDGMWAFRRSLIIDPETARFPLRCIFTNEPITRLLPFTIGHIQHAAIGPAGVVKKSTRIEFLPVSESWLVEQKKRGLLLGRLLLLGSFLTIGIGVTLCFKMPQNDDANTLIISMGVLSAIVGAALPRLAGFSGSREIYSAYFFQDGRILIPKPHPEFIVNIPRLKPKFLHGLLGIEQLIPDADE